MDSAFSRRVLAAFVAVAALAVPSTTAAGPTQDATLQQRLTKALHVPHVAPARSAAVALDLASGTVLFAQNGNRSLAPASNEKLPLAYAALAKLGPDYRIETDVLGEGGQDGSSGRARSSSRATATRPSPRRACGRSRPRSRPPGSAA